MEHVRKVLQEELEKVEKKLVGHEQSVRCFTEVIEQLTVKRRELERALRMLKEVV